MTAADRLDVLIVEDEVPLAEELAFLVREAGLRDVGRAISSAEAIALAGALSPDLALVDVHPVDGPTGVETARLTVRQALAYLDVCLREARAPGPPPQGLELSPQFSALWGGDQTGAG